MSNAILNYSHRPRYRRPMSRLAATAFGLAVATCPLLLALTYKLMPQLDRLTARGRHITRIAIPDGIALTFAVIALVQIDLSRGRIRGGWFAKSAVLMSMLWLAMDLLTWLIVASLGG
jgi:hypothetical protein